MFVLLPIKTNRIQTHEMYHLLLNAFHHHYHLLFDWLSYYDVVLTAGTTAVLHYTHTLTRMHREPAEKLVPSIMIAQVLD